MHSVCFRQSCSHLSISDMTLETWFAQGLWSLAFSGLQRRHIASCTKKPQLPFKPDLMVSTPGPLPSGLRALSCGQNLSSEDGDRIRYHMVLSVGASLNVSCHLIADRHSSSATRDSRRQEVSWGQGVCFIYWFGKIFSLPGTGMCIPCAWSHEIWQVPYQMLKTVIQLSLI